MEPILEKFTDDEEAIFYLITTFNPMNDHLRDIVLKNWGILKRSSATKDLSMKKVVFGYRKCPNLKNILVRAKLKLKREVNPHPNAVKGGRNECKTRNCHHWPMLNHAGGRTSTYTSIEYSCKKNVIRKSSNLMYCIQCRSCKMWERPVPQS